MTPTIPEPSTAPYDERASLRSLWPFYLVLGVVSIVVGILAINFAFIATLAKVAVFGVLLLIAGATEVIHAFMTHKGKDFALHLLAAALYLFVGVFMLEDLEWSAKVLTLLLAASFLVAGMLRIIFSLGTLFPAWPWVLLNGVVDVVLGVLIWRGMPETSFFVIGLFVGIDLIFHGWAWVILALGLRAHKPVPAA